MSEEVKVAECRFGAALLEVLTLEQVSVVLGRYLELRDSGWNPRSPVYRANDTEEQSHG